MSSQPLDPNRRFIQLNCVSMSTGSQAGMTTDFGMEIPEDPWVVDNYIRSALSNCWVMLVPSERTANLVMALTAQVVDEFVVGLEQSPELINSEDLSTEYRSLTSQSHHFALPDGPWFVAGQIHRALRACLRLLPLEQRSIEEATRVVRQIFERQIGAIQQDQQTFGFK